MRERGALVEGKGAIFETGKVDASDVASLICVQDEGARFVATEPWEVDGVGAAYYIIVGWTTRV